MDVKLQTSKNDTSILSRSTRSSIKPGSQTPSIARSQKKRVQVSLSPLSLKSNTHKNTNFNQSHTNTSNKITIKCPEAAEKLSKKFDISQKNLKHNPARFLIPQYRERTSENKFNLPTIDSDMQLLKKINQKSDQEIFDLDRVLENLGYCCRQEITHINIREKRVRFQLF